MEEWIKKSDVLEMLSLPSDIVAEHIHELKGVLVDEDWSDKDAVCFRYKRADGAIMYCLVEENKLFEDEHIDDHCVYLDMDDNDIENLIEALQSMQSMTP